MRRLAVSDIVDLARGAAVLGTGGGGDPLIGRLLVEQAIAEGLTVDVITLDELADDALVISTAMMGAPTVVVEKAPSGDEAVISLRKLEQHLGRAADAIVPMECGGLNSMIPLLTAARAGIPVVDADGMGRAFPELQMQTFAVYGSSGSPMVITNEHGNHVLVDTGADNLRMEQFARAVTVSMGGVAYIAEFAMSGAEVKRAAVPDTLQLAQDIGRVLRESREQHTDPFAALTRLLAHRDGGLGAVLASGKVIDVERVVEGGWTTGTVQLEPFDGDGVVEILFRNENLLATRNGEVLAIVPDLVTLMDAETGAPITTEAVRYGQRVVVYGIAAAPIMTTPEALAVFGPGSFGLEQEWVALQELVS